MTGKISMLLIPANEMKTRAEDGTRIRW